MHLHHGPRDPESFVRHWGDSTQADAAARQTLLDRLHLLMAWYKTLRKAIHVAGKAQPDSAVFQQQGDAVLEATTSVLSRHGVFTLVLTADEIRTPEGFCLPWGIEGDELHALFPLVRDGIVGLTLHETIAADTVRGLLILLAAEGRKAGHDALTWLWSMRDPHLHIAVGAWLQARPARALAMLPGSPVAYRAYATVLERVAPQMRPAGSALLEPATMADFDDPAYSVERSARLYAAGLEPGELHIPSARTRVGFATAAADVDISHSRRATIQQWAR
jgi:hypothetical protein